MKPKTKTILFIIFSFSLGVVFGILLDSRILHKQFYPQVKRGGDFQKMLVERLKLDESQTRQLDSLLELRKMFFENQRKTMMAMRDTMQLEIKKLLNAEQIKLFDELNQEFNKRVEKRWKKEADKK